MLLITTKCLNCLVRQHLQWGNKMFQNWEMLTIKCLIPLGRMRDWKNNNGVQERVFSCIHFPRSGDHWQGKRFSPFHISLKMVESHLLELLLLYLWWRCSVILGREFRILIQQHKWTINIFPNQGGVQLEWEFTDSDVPMLLPPLSFLVMEIGVNWESNWPLE